MAKEELLTLEGQIDEIFPDGRFGVMLENDHRIIAYTAGKMRKFRIRSVVGDRVRVLPAHVDPTVASHERMHVVRGDDVLGTWPVDLRNW